MPYWSHFFDRAADDWRNIRCLECAWWRPDCTKHQAHFWSFPQSIRSGILFFFQEEIMVQTIILLAISLAISWYFIDAFPHKKTGESPILIVQFINIQRLREPPSTSSPSFVSFNTNQPHADLQSMINITQVFFAETTNLVP